MTRSTPARSARDTLVRLAHLLDLALAEKGWDDQPTALIHTTTPDADGNFDLGLKDVDIHPALALLGTVAPDEWDTIGASQLGWVRPLRAEGSDAGGSAASPAGAERDTARRRVRVTTLMSRRAGLATVVRHEGSDETEEMPDGAVGRIPDVFSRCLGLPTPPPDVPVEGFFAAVWLAAIRQRAEASPRPLSWSEVERLHPAHRDDRPLPVAVVQQAKGIGWDGVRWQTIEGQWALAGVDAELAAWFDDGSFARWIYAQPEDLAAMGPTITEEAHVHIAALHRVLGIW